VLLTVEDTHVLTDSELADARKTMTEDEYRQEFLCSFEASIKGAYALISKCNDAERLGYPWGAIFWKEIKPQQKRRMTDPIKQRIQELVPEVMSDILTGGDTEKFWRELLDQ
jgi:hypothetical protein